MVMEKELVKWLQDRHLAKSTLRMLEKEHLVSAHLISQLREEDLDSLKTQYSLSMGHFIELREARDALLQGEFDQYHHVNALPKAHETCEPNQSNGDYVSEQPENIAPAAVPVSISCTCTCKCNVCSLSTFSIVPLSHPLCWCLINIACSQSKIIIWQSVWGTTG